MQPPISSSNSRDDSALPAQRKRPAPTAGALPRIERRSQHQGPTSQDTPPQYMNVFSMLTPEDGDAFIPTDSNALTRSVMEREREKIREPRTENTYNTRAQSRLASASEEQQSEIMTIDPSLIDPQIMSSQPMYNTWKSKDGVMASLLRDEQVLDFDILAIREPWRNAYHNTTHHPHRHLFNLIYLDDSETRVCTFISQKISKTRWTTTHHSPDYMTITITNGAREEDTLHIHNFYNPVAATGQSNISLLHEVLTASPEQNHIVVGNFNLHHPLWGGAGTRQDPESEELIQLMGLHQLQSLLPPGSVTYQNLGETTVDLALGTPWVHERKVFCGVREDLDHQSDHLPIATTIMVEVEADIAPEKCLWQQMDKDIFRVTLESTLPQPSALQTEGEIDQLTEQIVSCITRAIETSTPKARPCERSMPGWTQECKDAVTQARRLRRWYKQTRLPEDWEAYCQAQNHKAHLIQKTLHNAYRVNVQETASTQEGLF
ncbi:hypothetical protein CISG_07443 [Coccidioides immitis RMSCC 3703]|uniref:Endonuclease/exonuclease/phosphatase domain-containing protein n=1 Tax=Coccidioides immitis RMSCC 3703 TaxID=454286 RepID=A0A0J8QZV7_COCIT|nr:hypothetical protein CISG_07443 [Coccidioides immitis RMSCC 3703]